MTRDELVQKVQEAYPEAKGVFVSPDGKIVHVRIGETVCRVKVEEFLGEEVSNGESD